MSSNRVSDMGLDLLELVTTEAQRTQVIASVHHFFINDEIDNTQEVMDLIKTLKMSRQGDVIQIHLNSHGGRLDTCLQIIHSIRNTQALVVCVADGYIFSGASLIFFSGHQFLVNPYAQFMMHDAGGGEVGKLNEMDKSLKSSRQLLYEVYHDVYEPYLTAEEVDVVLGGKDMYLTAEQVNGRIERALAEAEEEEEEDE